MILLMFAQIHWKQGRTHRHRNWGEQGTRAPNFSQIIRQSAPLQLEELPVFVYDGAPEYMCTPLSECFLP